MGLFRNRPQRPLGPGGRLNDTLAQAQGLMSELDADGLYLDLLPFLTVAAKTAASDEDDEMIEGLVKKALKELLDEIVETGREEGGIFLPIHIGKLRK